ncbi:hypothetical protein F2Q70_00021239 [Brassica cretica]|uniref:DUF4283 domain-containing protein n=1 Tax=Brassica cretica TaxID=69181 RepID=A0A8S9GNB8_BRACR|nr:hypothetical protein F2Q70_00021239 [Brassica cretica]
MGSSYRSKSAHMADIKGKGILYEDDDAPIKLFKMTLMSLRMPTQWGVQERVTANDLRNGKFLINFTSEEDLKSVLGKVPFHFNYCMFVLVRWEPIVHGDYPWIIPFWVELVGIPLHLRTVKNMKSIGGRLGHVNEDTIEHSAGRMLIDVDSRRPLKFTRNIESSEGDEVTIEIKYDRLFKHCTICGLMTHEKGYCPTVESTMRPQTERAGVFARVQLPQDQPSCQPLLWDFRAHDQRNMDRDRQTLHHSSRTVSHGNNRSDVACYPDASNHNDGFKARYHEQEKEISNSRTVNGNKRHQTHSDRIMRNRDNKPRRFRYDNTRYGSGPYDRKGDLTWREKLKTMSGETTRSPGHVRNTRDVVHDVFFNEQASRSSDHLDRYDHDRSRDEERSGGEHKKIGLASYIVSPLLHPPLMEENVTVRNKSLALSYSPQAPKDELENAQIIGALNGMELLESNDDKAMECDVQGDDLLGEELMEIEGQDQSIVVAGPSDITAATKRSKTT